MSRENRAIIILCLASILIAIGALWANAQSNDFEHWTTRQIKESAIFGGQTKTLYDLSGHWATTNTHARVMGIEKAAASVYPAEHDGGKACMMKVELVSFTVMGVPVNAVAAGSIYLGESCEPVDMRGAHQPMTVLNMNYPYTVRPEALYFDYEAHIEQSSDISKANASKRVVHYQGKDEAEVTVVLQRRWEDAEGRIHALRVGTAMMRIGCSTEGWQKGVRLPLRYGDISKQAGYRTFEGLNAQGYMCKNSLGKMVTIEEDGYDAEAQPTHLILMFSAGSCPPFSGHVGNWLKVDNVALK